jgi:tyrosyl-tRNA synthetase
MFGEWNRVEILKWLNKTELETFKKAIWGFDYAKENLFETIVRSWLAKSNSESRQSVQSWAIYINEQKILDFNYDVNSNFIGNKVLLLRKWKKNFRIITK